MRQPIVFATLMALMLAVAACGGKKPTTAAAPNAADPQATAGADGESASSGPKLDPEDFRHRMEKPPEMGQGIFGYNEPLEGMWMNGLGLRAVSQDRSIAVSIHNRTGSPVRIHPHQFRLTLPNRQLYEFKGDRNDLLWFPDEPIPHGGREVFVVGVPDLPQLIGLGLVFNYPPKKVLARTQVEPVGLVAGPQ